MDEAERQRFDDWERVDGFVRLRIRATRTEDGGRTKALFNGYRVNWSFDPDDYQGQFSGPITIEGKSEIAPGEEGIVRLHLLVPEHPPLGWEELEVGTELTMVEGPHKVASGTVIEIVPAA